MATINLTTVDQTLAFYEPTLSQDHVDAFSNTLMFAQAAARMVNADPSSMDYFNSMQHELTELGWNVISAGKDHIDEQADKIEPKDIIKNAISNYLAADEKDQLNGFLDAIQQPDVSIHNFLSFWWNKAKTNASKTNMAIGKLKDVDNQPSITLVFYGFDFSADNWRSLFVEKDSASLNVDAFHLKIQLNYDFYEANFKDTLVKRLSGKVQQHVQDAPLDI